MHVMLLIAKRVTEASINFQKIINYFILSKCTATKFFRITLQSLIVFPQKIKLKLIRAKSILELPMIFRNELSITLSTL